MAKTPQEHAEAGRPEPAHHAAAVRVGGAASRQTLRNVRLIIGREYKSRVTQRSFVIVSIILLALVAVAPFVPTIVQLIAERTNAPTQATQVVVVNTASMVAGLDEMMLTAYITTTLNGSATGSSAPYAISSQPPTALDSLRSQVANGKLDILLILSRAPNQQLQLTYVANTSATNDSNLSTIQALASQLTVLDTAARLGLTPAQTRSLFAPPDLTITRTQSDQTQSVRPEDQIAAVYVVAIFGGYLLATAVIIYARAVADGVAEEKSSRVMELLLNAATPWQLLVGKILGIGAAGLTQLACLTVVGIGAQLLQTPLRAALFGANAGGSTTALAGMSVLFYFLLLLYFVLAFFLYATLFAGLGALVKRQDEVQSLVLIFLPLLLGSFGVIYLGAFAPNSIWAKVLSYVPFWTPTLMLTRLALGTVAWWEIVATTAWMLLAIVASTWFAARLYRYGVLMYGQRPGLGQLLKLVRMN